MASKTRKSKRTSHSRHKHPESANASGFLGLVIVVLGIWYWFWYRPSKVEIPATYDEQISQLDTLEHGLENLQDFVASQRESLVQQNYTLEELKAESDRLQPIVEADKETVKAVLAAHSRSQSAQIWRERIIAFIIGVASSIVAACLFARFRRMEPTEHNQQENI